ncbi:MAG TPA: alpha/beta fold hydrolase [Acidobacteriota bacterium]|nr:alpha/beta fold hydrolase [Acidobacteriota bacterium]
MKFSRPDTFIIPGRTVHLEAILREPNDTPLRGAAVLCHPHPVYGGTMDNRVVFRAGKAIMEASFAALRFNFRGVGSSTGTFDQGIGEKDDVVSVIDWLEQRYPAIPLALVGFSFGAWVGLEVAASEKRIRALAGLGLPLNFYDFEFLVENDKPSLFIVGTQDEFCPRDRIERLARRLPPTSRVALIEGADHFFARELDRVQQLITQFFQELRLDGVGP